jgi:rare lipoprotein A
MTRIHTLAAAAALALSGVIAAHAQTAAPAAQAAAPAAAPTAAPAATPTAAPAAAPAGDASEGKLAWYGKKFAGRKTASGERFNPNAMTIVHKTLPFGTRVKVTNLANKRSVVLRVNGASFKARRRLCRTGTGRHKSGNAQTNHLDPWRLSFQQDAAARLTHHGDQPRCPRCACQALGSGIPPRALRPPPCPAFPPPPSRWPCCQGN